MARKLFLCFIILLFAKTAYTIEPDFKILQYPVVCTSKDKMEEYLKDYNFELQSVSLLKEEQDDNGTPLLVVEYYLNKKKTESIILLTTLDNKESCMVGRTFNLKKYKGEPA
jgi:hypothetical protein